MSINMGRKGINISDNQQGSPTSQRLTLILGYLWSGKTTLTKELAKRFMNNENTLGLIINDIGQINIDANRLSEYEVEALTQWCICCDDNASIIPLLEQKKAAGIKSIIIEPSGVASWDTIIAAAKNIGFTVDVISLFNAQTFHKKLNDITTLTHINLADIIGLTHIGGQDLEEMKKYIRAHNPKAPILSLPNPLWENIIKNTYAENVIQQLVELRDKPKRESFLTDKLEWVAHAKPKPRSVFLSEYVSIDDIQTLIDTLWNVERVKWVINVWGAPMHFDYVEGDTLQLSWKVPEHLISQGLYMNIITTNKLDESQVALLQEIVSKNSHLDNSTRHSMKDPILTKEQADQAVDALLQQYTDYMQMYDELTLLKNNSWEWDIKVEAIEELQRKMNELGDAMKFDNPYIWLKYKYLAYANNPNKKVSTLEELKNHCSTKTDICYKRFDFLHKKVQERYNLDITNESMMDGNTSIPTLLVSSYITELCQDPDFMRSWVGYEYFTINNKVSKRQNY
jgi:G3E family GTPase